MSNRGITAGGFVATALKSLSAKHVILNGEIAALDEKGRSANHLQRQVQIAD